MPVAEVFATQAHEKFMCACPGISGQSQLKTSLNLGYNLLRVNIYLRNERVSWAATIH